MEKTILVDKNSAGKMFVEKFNLKPAQKEDFKSENDFFYYVISGYGVMSVESYGYNLEQETSVFVPKNSTYSFTNTGDVDLVLVCYGIK